MHTLDTNENHIYLLKLTTMNLGNLMQDLVHGRIPNGTRKKVRLLNPEKPFKGDYIGIRKN